MEEKIRIEIIRGRVSYLELFRTSIEEYGTPFKWQHWYLHRLYVPKSVRGQGLARALMDRMVATSVGLHLDVALHLRPFKPNCECSFDRSISTDRLRRFYNDYGFRTRPTRIENGLWMIRRWDVK